MNHFHQFWKHDIEKWKENIHSTNRSIQGGEVCGQRPPITTPLSLSHSLSTMLSYSIPPSPSPTPNSLSRKQNKVISTTKKRSRTRSAQQTNLLTHQHSFSQFGCSCSKTYPSPLLQCGHQVPKGHFPPKSLSHPPGPANSARYRAYCARPTPNSAAARKAPCWRGE